jgi:hypothetical protein
MGGWHRRPGPGAPVVALAALVLAAGCTVRIRPDPAPTSIPGAPAAATTTSTGPVSRGTTIASRAFTLVLDWPDGTLRRAGAGPLPVAMRQGAGPYGDEDIMVTLVLVFPLLRAQPDCVHQVELWLRVLRFDHQFRYQDPQLAAYPSLLVSLASARPAIRAGDVTLLDNRPKGDAELTRDEAWMHFNLTELYRTWAEGGPFPSQSRIVRRGTPLVVDVRAADLAQELFEARVAPIGGDPETAPQLRWVATRDCPAGG